MVVRSILPFFRNEEFKHRRRIGPRPLPLGPTFVLEKMEASAGFEPAVEVLQPAIWSSPEVARVHCDLDLDADRSLEFALVQQGSAALPSPLPSPATRYVLCLD